MLPSYREGLPRTLVEAAAVGRAVITTDVPGCRDAIVPGVTGLLVASRNVQQLEYAIEYLIDNPDQRVEMGKKGRVNAERKFSIIPVVEKHMDIYSVLTCTID